MDETTPTNNAHFLRGQLLERLLAVEPEGVLDVGCGRGELLQLCKAGGLPAVGLEASRERAVLARSSGAAAIVASGEQLPFADVSVPWVVMRHVAHHLGDPQRGVTEMARVAGQGVIVAEPHRPQDRAEQRTALAVDLWCKIHHRRQGHIHHPDVSAAEMVSWLRQAWGTASDVQSDVQNNVQIDVHEVHRPALLPRATVQADLEAAVADLPRDHPEVQRVTEWLALADDTGVGATGSVIVVARRR
ncbi:MAG: SAM-dependent methyltransferase [Pseudohongiellaceae bacterium]|jgi:SAM-dependent methyltransferase